MKEYNYKIGTKILVNDKMQKGYTYTLTCQIGKNFDSSFTPHLSPKEMLELGAFEGKYLNDCTNEFPEEWFKNAQEKHKLSPEKANESINYFQIKSRQSLQIWKEKGWIECDDPDVRGWFQWYCRYYLGRRIQKIDTRQIKRWRAFNRHAGQIKKNCDPGNLYCRPKQRQALLQWAHNPFI
jgi:hypothetical protein